MLLKNTLLKVDDAFIERMSNFDNAIANEKDQRARFQRNSMQETDPYDYDGYFKVILAPVEENINNDTISVVDGFDPENEYAGWAYYNATPVHCNKGTVVVTKSGFVCLNIDSESKVSYTIEDTVPPFPIIESDSTSNSSGTGKKVIAYVSIEANNFYIRQIFQHDIPEIKVWGECEQEEVEE